MPGLTETFAAKLTWSICECNVIVEGTSDVELLWLAAALYFEKHKAAILGDQIAVLAAGKADEGGVDGLNRRLNAARQIADADRGPDGSLRYRFIGLFDNDHAGRRAVEHACLFDRRLLLFRDLFLIYPRMSLANGADHADLRRRVETENAQCKGLDWEIEDFLSERLINDFALSNPSAIQSSRSLGGFTHWEFTREGKFQLHRFTKSNATLEDLQGIVQLIRALRDYCRLPIADIVA